ncbi:malate dehydrogenase [Dipodascopsis tothii]|uniref:malate dehydrogenase n=1 Tax=Dipodascopsis tothii TaxID=44089 RepID=UPI0034CD2219
MSEKALLSHTGPIICPFEGRDLLNAPEYNKGTAFSKDERETFKLVGLLPPKINSLDSQVQRAYEQYSARGTNIAKNTFLMSMKYQNHVLYFRLLQDHIKEMMSIVYTPTEGDAIEQYSRLFRRPDGVFLDIDHESEIRQSLEAWGRPGDVDYIIVSDGEEILGIGDQGIGAIGISSAKAVLMTLCAGVHPSRIMPVALDVGTDNSDLLNDRLYLGRRKPRVRGERYDSFVDKFVQTVKEVFPRAVLHFEDFGLSNARRLLDLYRPQLPCFNDDVQGTGAVTLSALTAALRVIDMDFKDLRIIIFGAGTAGTGIADQIKSVMTAQGISEQLIFDHIWLVDKPGLLISKMDILTDAQRPYAANSENWNGIDTTSLFQIVKKIKPHVLIGCSTKPKAFTEEVVKEMARHVERPVILPLSNPTRLHEAVPADLLAWTNNKALVATGSPFDPVDGIEIAENNNCFVYPGIGMGSVLARADRITDTMIAAVVNELAEDAPINFDQHGGLLPDISDIREVSAKIATAVVLQSLKEGTARVELLDDITVPREKSACLSWVKERMWTPEYRNLVKM